MDTLPAFRGLVMAAKAPDSRVRKYTHWALERLDSLAME